MRIRVTGLTVGLIWLAGLYACNQKLVITQEGKTAVPKDPNPFFAEFDTPYGVPPFGRIGIQHYQPAFQKGMELQTQEIRAIVENPQPPSFENTIVALDGSGEFLARVSRVFYSLLGSDADKPMLDLAKTLSPILSKHRDDILLNSSLYKKIKTVYQQKGSLQLSVEQNMLLENTYLDFMLNGAELSSEDMEKLRRINRDLGLATLQYGQNLLDEVNLFELVVDNPSDLAGLPESVVEAAKKTAEERGKSGKWVFTLDKPSLIPFLQYSQIRSLREKMYLAYIDMGNHGDERDNKELVQKIVSLRLDKARMLGFDTYADLKLRRRMAKETKTVIDFLQRLWVPALKVAKREAAGLQALALKDGKNFELQPWDWWYYAEMRRMSEYDLDDSQLRPYFKLENVRAGAFAVANKLYGIRFVARPELPVYHQNVEIFEVLESDGTSIGLFYTDYFPRRGKRSGAWCGGFRESYMKAGKRIAPLVTNVCNFTKPTSDKPALLSLEEVGTLFHEFGHALHALFINTQYRGTQDVPTDFVELPSQIMEHWAYAPAVMKQYARHYETGEPIPDALIEKIEKSRYFNQGFQTIEYLAACRLDMDWHMVSAHENMDVAAFESKSTQSMGLIEQIAPRYRSTYFRHIFGGDFYTAGYYSYIWSGVLDADAFEAFKESSLFDQKAAQAFRKHVLSSGGSEDPLKLYKRFRGAEPSIEPLLRNRGLL